MASEDIFHLCPIAGKLKSLQFSSAKKLVVLVSFVGRELVQFSCDDVSIQKNRNKLKCVQKGNEFHVMTDGMILKLVASVPENEHCFTLLTSINRVDSGFHGPTFGSFLKPAYVPLDKGFRNSMKEQSGIEQHAKSASLNLKRKLISDSVNPVSNIFGRTYGSRDNTRAFGGHSLTSPVRPHPLPSSNSEISFGAGKSSHSAPGTGTPLASVFDDASPSAVRDSASGHLNKPIVVTNTTVRSSKQCNINTAAPARSDGGIRGLFARASRPSINEPVKSSLTALISGTESSRATVGSASPSASSAVKPKGSVKAAMSLSDSRIAALFASTPVAVSKDQNKENVDLDLFRIETGSRLLSHTGNPKPHAVADTSEQFDTRLESEFRWRGIRNLGNTCYAGSILQILLVLSSFTHDLFNLYQEAGAAMSAAGVAERAPMLTALMRLLVQHQSSGTRSSLAQKSLGFGYSSSRVALDLAPFQAAVFRLNKQFTTYKQHDSHEYLISLLELIYGQIKILTATSIDVPVQDLSAGDSYRCPVLKNFQFEIKNSITCGLCGAVLVNKEYYRDLSLDHVPAQGGERMAESGPVPLVELLKGFFAPELRNMKCDKCAVATTAEPSLPTASVASTSTMRVVKECISLPQYLVLHLKRFYLDLETNTVVKVPYPVAITPTIDMSAFCSSSMITNFNNSPDSSSTLVACRSDTAIQSQSQSGCQYGLKGIVRHIGLNAVSGHYIADVRPEFAAPTSSDVNGISSTKDSMVDSMSAAVTDPLLWRRCDDSIVKPISECEVLKGMTQTPYLIVFERL